MSSTPNLLTSLMMYLWPLLSLLFGALQVTAAILLLRERGMGPWMMLCGSVIGLIGSVGSSGFSILSRLYSIMEVGNIMILLSFVSAFGHLLFTIGLLLYALQRRALANRITELEAILHSRVP